MEDTTYDREMTVKLLERQAERLLEVLQLLRTKGDWEAVEALRPAQVALRIARARLRAMRGEK